MILFVRVTQTSTLILENIVKVPLCARFRISRGAAFANTDILRTSMAIRVLIILVCFIGDVRDCDPADRRPRGHRPREHRLRASGTRCAA